MDKTLETPSKAVALIRSGDSVALGGFGVPGAPIELMRALVQTDVANLELIANNGGLFEWQLGQMLDQGRIRRVIASHIGLNQRLEAAYRAGVVEVELIPQGTLVEKLRAAGAGIPAFYCPTGAGTLVEYGGLPWKYGPLGDVIKSSPAKPTASFDGRICVLERAIRPDVALIRAWRGDRLGNLVFHQSARNFNPIWAMAARVVIAEVEELVEPGAIDPDQVHTPGVWVDHVVEVGAAGKWHELPLGGSTTVTPDGDHLNSERSRIAQRVALEFKSGEYINLGVGIPTLAAAFVPSSVTCILHSENGVLGLGAAPPQDLDSFDLTNASKEAATIIVGGAFVDSADAFAIVRGGRLDVAVLGAMQVSERGDLANWMVPGRAVSGMGGAMDLVVGAKRTVVATLHSERSGAPKIVSSCSYPLTGSGVVDRIVTERAVIDVTAGGLVLREIADGYTVDQVVASTGAPLLVPERPTPMLAKRL